MKNIILTITLLIASISFSQKKPIYITYDCAGIRKGIDTAYYSVTVVLGFGVRYNNSVDVYQPDGTVDKYNKIGDSFGNEEKFYCTYVKNSRKYKITITRDFNFVVIEDQEYDEDTYFGCRNIDKHD